MTLKIFPVLALSSIVALTPAALKAQQQAAPAASAPEVKTKTVQATAVPAELKSSIDSKKAKQGDEVSAVVKQDVTLSDGTKLAKGTTIMGHVTEASAFDKKAGKAGSVTILFDKAKSKDGNTTPILSMVQQIQPSPMAQYQMAQQGGAAPDAGGSAPVPAAPSGGSDPAAGGASGSAQAGASMPSTSSMPSASTTPASGKDAAPAPSGAVASGIPNVMLAPPPNNSASGVVASTSQNVHVDSGSQLILAVAVGSNQPQGQ